MILHFRYWSKFCHFSVKGIDNKSKICSNSLRFKKNEKNSLLLLGKRFTERHDMNPTHKKLTSFSTQNLKTMR